MTDGRAPLATPHPPSRWGGFAALDAPRQRLGLSLFGKVKGALA
ncbi:MAG: hypothetical protein AAF755_05475 [Pseudomonadota bacterium]